jgi:putative redox protein
MPAGVRRAFVPKLWRRGRRGGSALVGGSAGVSLPPFDIFPAVILSRYRQQAVGSNESHSQRNVLVRQILSLLYSKSPKTSRDLVSPFPAVCILEARMENMEVTAHYLRDSQFEVIAREHRVICDQPVENGGSNAGMTPPEFLLASLAACAAYYANQYFNLRGLPAAGLAVRVTAEKLKQPARLGSFRIEVAVPGLEERHEGGLLRAVKACLIHNTLLSAPAIQALVHTAAGAGVPH